MGDRALAPTRTTFCSIAQHQIIKLFHLGTYTITNITFLQYGY